MHRLAQRDSFVDYRSRYQLHGIFEQFSDKRGTTPGSTRLFDSYLSTNILLFYLYLLTYLLIRRTIKRSGGQVFGGMEIRN